MRHLGSLLAALVVAPVAWVLLALGQSNLYASWDQRDTLVAVPPWPEKLGYLAAAGLLIGLIASTRISPVGPLAAGLAYLGAGTASLWLQAVHNVLPAHWTVLNRDIGLRAPLDNGTAIVLGVVLLTAILSVRRWRRWPKPVAAGVAAAVPDAEQPSGTDSADDGRPPVPAAQPDQPPIPPAPRPPVVVDEPVTASEPVVVDEPTADERPPAERLSPATDERPAAEPATERLSPAGHTTPSQREPAESATERLSPAPGQRPPGGPIEQPAAPPVQSERAGRDTPEQPAGRHPRPEGTPPGGSDDPAADHDEAAPRGDVAPDGDDSQPPRSSSPWSAPPRQNPR